MVILIVIIVVVIVIFRFFLAGYTGKDNLSLLIIFALSPSDLNAPVR